MLEFIADKGDWFYVITFIWAFFEGETFVIFAGLAAHLGILRLDVLIACAWLGSFCGDQLYYWVGRRYGVTLLERFPRWRPQVARALDFLHRYDTWFILSFRFIYLVRNFASFAMGMAGVPWPRFFMLNFIAAGCWATSFATFGYFFGKMFEQMIGDATTAFGIAMFSLFVFAVLLTVYLDRRHRRELPAPVKTGPIPEKTRS